MTSPAPDMSSLAIGDQDQEYDFNDMQQQHKTFHYAQSPANNPLSAQFQFAPASLGQQAMKKPARAALPSQWRDNPEEPAHAPVTPDGNVNRALSPPHTSDFSSSGGSPPPPSVPQIQPPQLYGIAQQGGGGGYSTVPHIPAPSSHHSDDDIIPNAIVIKNIPFTVKRETLLDIIASLNIPTPYAFNYHIDSNGQFRGLAFANFRVAGDADAVVAALNGFDVQGRKLRVEYKKVLLAGEKERIEREKAMRRMRSMQLEKERERNGEWDAFPTSVNNMPGLGSPGSGGGGEMSPNPMMPGMPSPSPNRFSPNVGMGAMFSPSIPQPYPSPPPPIAPSMKAISAQNELDLNDAATLEIYSRILVFKEDRMRDELAFSRTLTPRQRRIVHLAAQRLGVYHYSVGEGEERYAVVTRIPRDGDAAPRQPVRHASQTFLRSSSNNYGQSPTTPSRNNLAAPNEGLGFFKKQSMPNLKSAYGTEPGGRSLQNRPSNSNLSAYKTLTGYEPRRNKEFGALFGGSDIPPVPTLPTIPSMEGGGANGNGVVRQPRGPGNGGFARRPAEIRSTSNSGLDARTHEPLEI